MTLYGSARLTMREYKKRRREEREREIHERHVDLWASCRLCRIEAGAQTDRLRKGHA